MSPVARVRRSPGKGQGTCRVCGTKIDQQRRNAAGKIIGKHNVKTCPRHRWLRGGTKIIIDKHTRYEEDVACQLFVRTFPDGATLDSIAMALGVSRERVRQIEGDAKRKLRGGGLPAFGLEEEPPRHDEPGGRDASEDEEAVEPGAADDDGPELILTIPVDLDAIDPEPW